MEASRDELAAGIWMNVARECANGQVHNLIGELQTVDIAVGWRAWSMLARRIRAGDLHVSPDHHDVVARTLAEISRRWPELSAALEGDEPGARSPEHPALGE